MIILVILAICLAISFVVVSMFVLTARKLAEFDKLDDISKNP